MLFLSSKTGQCFQEPGGIGSDEAGLAIRIDEW